MDRSKHAEGQVAVQLQMSLWNRYDQARFNDDPVGNKLEIMKVIVGKFEPLYSFNRIIPNLFKTIWEHNVSPLLPFMKDSYGLQQTMIDKRTQQYCTLPLLETPHFAAELLKITYISLPETAAISFCYFSFPCVSFTICYQDTFRLFSSEQLILTIYCITNNSTSPCIITSACNREVTHGTLQGY